MRRRVVLGVGDRIVRGLGVAGAGEHPGEVAGLGPHRRSSASRCGSISRRKARQDFIAARKSCTATASTRFRSSHGGPARVEDVVGDVPQRLPDRLCGPNPGFLLMRQLYDGYL